LGKKNKNSAPLSYPAQNLEKREKEKEEGFKVFGKA